MNNPKNRRLTGRTVLLATLIGSLQGWGTESNWLARQWQVEDGLPDNTVTAIQQTTEGYLWLSTLNGLARFDGVQFKTFDSANTPELRSSRILCLFADPAGALWIGTEGGGLLRMVEERFQNVPLGKFGASADVSAMFSDRNGALWLLAGGRGVARLAQGQLETFNEADLTADKLPGLSHDPAVRAWLSARHDLLTFRAGSWFSRPSQKPLTGSELVAVQRSRNGAVWTAYPRRLARLGSEHEPAARNLSWGSDFSSALVTTLAEHASGKLFIGTLNNGLYCSSKPGEYLLVKADGPLSQNVIFSVFEDRQGIIWIGTYQAGLFRIKPRTVTTLVPPGAGEVNVQTCCAARDGSIWLGTGGAGLYRYSQGTFVHYAATDGLANLHVCSVFEDTRTNLWVGTWGGLFLREGERFRAVTEAIGLPERVLALYEDRAGDLWVGAYGGLARKQGDQWTLFTPAEGLSHPDVRALAEDAQGNLWVGTAGGGLDRLREGRLSHFQEADEATHKVIIGLQTDAEGTTWISTIGGGLVRLKDARVTSFTTEDGLPGNVIGGLAEDGLGNLWMTSPNGILRVNKRALNAYSRGPGASLACLSLSVADGLATPICSGSGQPIIARAADGRLWLPNMKAVAVVNPRALPSPMLVPSVLVEDLIIDGRRNPSTPGIPLRVRSSRNSVEFRYTALGLRAPESARFRCKLEGLDSDWVSAGARRQAFYTQLPAGRYHFRVMAAGSDGVWHEAPGPVTLEIVLPPWERRWLQVLAGMLLVAILGSAAFLNERRKLRRRLKRLEMQQALETERGRIARDIHDDLGASLTRIAMLSQSALDKSPPSHSSAEDVSRIYSTARAMTRAMDEIVWAINPRHDSLDSVAAYFGEFVGEYLGATGLIFRLEIPLDLPQRLVSSELRHNLFLAFKEALHNVVKHARAREVIVSLVVRKSGFTLAVADDGCGFTSSLAPPGSSSPVSATRGNGLGNMRRRLEQSGCRCQVASAPGRGTRVTFEVLLPA